MPDRSASLARILLGDVVAVAAGQRHRQQDALRFSDHVVLGARPGTVDRARSPASSASFKPGPISPRPSGWPDHPRHQAAQEGSGCLVEEPQHAIIEDAEVIID